MVNEGPSSYVDLPQLVRHPVSGAHLENVRLEVVGPDALRPVAPSLVEGLPRTHLLDADSPRELAAAMEALLRTRLEGAQRVRKEMQRLRLRASLDEARLVATAEIEVQPLGTIVLEGNDRGVRAVRLQPQGGSAPVDLDIGVKLAEHLARVDLEVFLSHPVERALRGAPASAPRTLREEAAADGSTSLGRLQDLLGADARLHPDLSITRDFQLAGRRVRFEARRSEAGRNWKASITAEGRTVWSGDFDLASSLSIESIAARQLGLEPLQGAAPITLGPDRAVESGVAGQLVPVAGEIWVMGVLVDSETADEVRYVLVDIDGKSYGPVRTMPPADFAATFQQIGPAWRLAARVLRVTDDRVEWVQLDPAGKPVGQVRAGALAMFVHHFLPQAAAY